MYIITWNFYASFYSGEHSNGTFLGHNIYFIQRQFSVTSHMSMELVTLKESVFFKIHLLITSALLLLIAKEFLRIPRQLLTQEMSDSFDFRKTM